MGVFICIRCAGIHRSLGTHISKVKSVDLDTWKEEHLRKVVEFGNNKRANAVYECKLQGDHTPDASQLGNFIRNKYEAKKWFGESGEPVARPEAVPRASAPTETVSQPVSRTSSAASSMVSSAPVSMPASLHGSAAASATASQVNLNLTPVTGTGVAATLTPKSGSTVPASTPLDGRPDLKRSILSLYARPRNSASGSLASSVSPAPGPSTSAAPAFAGAYAPSVTAPTTSLEDNELFKNVWS